MMYKLLMRGCNKLMKSAVPCTAPRRSVSLNAEVALEHLSHGQQRARRDIDAAYFRPYLRVVLVSSRLGERERSR